MQVFSSPRRRAVYKALPCSLSLIAFPALILELYVLDTVKLVDIYASI